MPNRHAYYVIKVAIEDPAADILVLPRQKTMYGGKHIAPGDAVFVFASENASGAGLVMEGVVLAADPVPPVPGVPRQTPRVTVTVRRVAGSERPVGRPELKGFRDWEDGRPETELNFKLYRQATDKIVGISEGAAEFLRSHLPRLT
jgi:hypothetical protein